MLCQTIWHFCLKLSVMKSSAIFKCITSAAFIVLCFFIIGAKPKQPKPRVLIFSKTNGYRHASIAAGIAAIKKIGAENEFDVDATEDSMSFNNDNLKKYAALIFLSTTGKIFGPDEEKALQQYIISLASSCNGRRARLRMSSDCTVRSERATARGPTE